MTKSKSILPDTNVILRYLLKDNENLYKMISSKIEEIRLGNRHAIILEGVLIECIYVLTKFYNVPRREAARNLRDFLRYNGIRNKDKNELIAALELFTERKIDIVDCILYAKAVANDMDVLTLDKDILSLLKDR
jgi:predicted nucleic-acid-binding protein